MYEIVVRKLALRMIRQIGVLKTSAFTNISRSTLWRWKRFGADPKRRVFESKLFESNKDLLKSFLLSNQVSLHFSGLLIMLNCQQSQCTVSSNFLALPENEANYEGNPKVT